MKHGAIFDMDGTLLNTERFYTQGWLETADKFGVERNPELAKAMSGSAVTDMPEIMHRFYPGIDAAKYLSIVVDFVKSESEKTLELMPGVKEILEYFKSQNVVMAVASSSLKNVVDANLTRTGIRDYFKVVIGGNQIKNGKPAPDIFLKAAEELGVAPDDCYVFEDSLNGVRAGHAAGASTIMIPDQAEPTEEIKKICRVYDSLNDAMLAIINAEL